MGGYITMVIETLTIEELEIEGMCGKRKKLKKGDRGQMNDNEELEILKGRMIVDGFIRKNKQPNGIEIKGWTHDMVTYFRKQLEVNKLKEMEDLSMDTEDVLENNTSIAKRVNEADIGKAAKLSKVADIAFGGWDWVSNSIHSCKGCRIIIGWDKSKVDLMVLHMTSQLMFVAIELIKSKQKVFCCYVYASNSGVERRILWNELRNIKAITSGCPWLLMGDFNVTLNLEEHSAGGSKINGDMQDFRDCVNDIEVEDINSSGMFFTWIKLPLKPETCEWECDVMDINVKKLEADVKMAQVEVEANPSCSIRKEKLSQVLNEYNIAIDDEEKCWSKVKQKVNDWKNKTLSYAGRQQLIASVLASMHIYWASVFLIPKSTVKDIEKVLKGFLWSQGDLKKGAAKIAWKIVCTPKNKGGLGIKSLGSWNEALLCKHLWNENVKDSTVWRDGNGKEGRFSTQKVWENFRIDLPDVNWRIGWLCKRVGVSDSVMPTLWVGNVAELEEPLLHCDNWRLKRIFILNEMDMDMDVDMVTPKKRAIGNCFGVERSFLEALPQDVLIKVLCGVEHDDLKRLFHVSKPIREAAMIAKKLHFEYSTPKKIPAFRCSVDQSSLEFDEIEAPNAPRQLRVARSRLNKKKLANLSVALFASSDEE
ncbi:RNA-directed DNA polymerase, eukaryota, reverse transcriptase zinc-binding domain protein [Tanacetum coccineum]